MSDLTLCYLCEENPTTEDDFCFGCKESICSDCSKNMNAGGFGHDPEDHLVDEDDYEEEDDDDD